MSLHLIVAAAQNGVIGRDGRLPWRLPSDLKRFKELTTGHPVVMGRKTWESLPATVRPLPGRENIVVTRDHFYHAPGAQVVHAVPDALGAVDRQEGYVIGGSSLYRAALPFADTILATKVLADVEGDVHFPLTFAEMDRRWERAVEGPFQEAGDEYPYAFITYYTRSSNSCLVKPR